MTLLTMKGEESHDKQIYVFRGHSFIAYVDCLYIRPRILLCSPVK